MKPAKIFQQYIWIVNTLRKHGRLTLNEISDLWIRDKVIDGKPLTRISFYRHKDAILNMFGILISCDMEHGFKYFIDNPDVLNDNAIERWMLSMLTVNTALTDSASLSDRILLESVPAGEHYIQIIIQAIKSGRRLLMGYKKFGDEGYVKTVSPYALKLSHRRWYLLALTDDQQFRIYSLDRMTSLEATEESFEMPEDFSPEAYFAEYYGVLTDNTPMAHVVVRAYGKTADYLRTLPLHRSQRELETEGAHTGEYADFAIDIRPTIDFIGAILSQGEGLEVLQPTDFRLKIREKLIEILNKY